MYVIFKDYKAVRLRLMDGIKKITYKKDPNVQSALILLRKFNSQIKSLSARDLV